MRGLFQTIKKQLLNGVEAHLFILLFFYLIAWNFWLYMPISEDAGFYGFIAKSVSGGAVLHKDIPIASNSLNIYILALIMKLFGSSLILFKIYHLFFSIALSIVVYFLLKRPFLPIFALVGSLCTGIILHLPHVMLDLGRNSIIVSLFLLFFGVYYYLYSSNKLKYFYFGILVGLSALVRETFLTISLFIIAGLFIELYKKKCNALDVKYFFFGFLLALSINALLLTVYGTWGGYLNDMLHSGVDFRYSEGVFSYNRIFDNLNVWRYGFERYYSSVIVLALISYLFSDNDKLFFYCKFVLVPAFAFEALIINKTASYSVQPLLVVSIILSIYTLKHLFSLFNRLKKLNINTKIAGIVIMYLAGTYVYDKNIINIVSEHSSYNKVALKNKRGEYIDANPSRILDIIERIDHGSISAYAQYPTLFLSKTKYKTRWPFYEDLSASGNMGTENIWTDQMNELKSINPPDLLIDKTTNSFLSKWTELGKIYSNNYIEIAYFDKPIDSAVVAPYIDRVSISKPYFNSSFELVSNSDVSLNIDSGRVKYQNIYDEPVIIKIVPREAACVEGLSVESALSMIEYNDQVYKDKQVYSFILPNNWAYIKNQNKNCSSYQLYTFKQKRQVND